MTNDRDFERITQAWMDLMPDQAPERVTISIVDAIEAIEQVRPPLLASMARALLRDRGLSAAVAVVTVVVVGGALVLGRLGPSVGGPTPSPSATPSTSPSGVVGLPPADSALRQTWLADKPDGLSFGDPSGPARVFLVFSASGVDASVRVSSGPGDRFVFSVGQLGAGAEIVFGTVSSAAAISLDGRQLAPCAPEVLGRYRPSLSTDGSRLTLTTIDDVCAYRTAVLARTWVRSLSAGPSLGGSGVVDVFEPNLLVTLPGGSFEPHVSADGIEITQASPELVFAACRRIRASALKRERVTTAVTTDPSRWIERIPSPQQRPSCRRRWPASA